MNIKDIQPGQLWKESKGMFAYTVRKIEEQSGPSFQVWYILAMDHYKMRMCMFSVRLTKDTLWTLMA